MTSFQYCLLLMGCLILSLPLMIRANLFRKNRNGVIVVCQGGLADNCESVTEYGILDRHPGVAVSFFFFFFFA
ncbi:hypothetical protein QBC44DRAFT_316883 [Cladorrhinum sp. PSN332]|nr:hypothetical protein QBC44DRAFT_316883 [Cladorrhinum sp. PSN332]